MQRGSEYRGSRESYLYSSVFSLLLICSAFVSEVRSFKTTPRLLFLHIKMTTLFRDTQFGHVVRFLSGNKLFRYPDESNHSLWEKFSQRESSSPGEHGEKIETIDLATTSAPQDLELLDRSVNHIVTGGKDIFLVDWYDADDPEVSICFYRFHATVTSHTALRIPRIGPARGSSSSVLKYAS